MKWWLPCLADFLVTGDSGNTGAGKDWGQEKGTTEDEMVVWHRRRDGRELEQTPGDGEGQGSLACCSPWGCKESDRTEWLNSNNINKMIIMIWSLVFQVPSMTISPHPQLVFQPLALQKNTTWLIAINTYSFKGLPSVVYYSKWVIRTNSFTSYNFMWRYYS